MAANVTRVTAPLNALSGEITAVALSSSGKTVDFEGKDGYTLIRLTCTANDTVTIVGGNGEKGIADMTLSLTANKTYAIILDSAYFMQVSRTNKGMVVIKGASTTSVEAIEVGLGR